MDLTHDLLPTIPLLRSLDASSLKRIADTIRPQTLKAGEALFRKGDDGNEMYIIESGTIKIVLPSSEGDEVILTVLRAPEFFGTMSMFDGKTRSADAVAVSDSRLLVLKRSDFIHVLQEDEEALQTLLCDLSSMVRKTDDLVEDLCFFPIKNRLARRLLELCEYAAKESPDGSITLDLSFKQRELAKMVGATRESVNRVLKKFEDDGIIEMENGKVTTVFEREALEALCENIDF